MWSENVPCLLCKRELSAARFGRAMHFRQLTKHWSPTRSRSSGKACSGSIKQMSDTDLAQLAAELQALNASVQSTAVSAPAVLNEAGGNAIVQLNAREREKRGGRQGERRTDAAKR